MKISSSLFGSYSSITESFRWYIYMAAFFALVLLLFLPAVVGAQIERPEITPDSATFQSASTVRDFSVGVPLSWNVDSYEWVVRSCNYSAPPGGGGSQPPELAFEIVSGNTSPNVSVKPVQGISYVGTTSCQLTVLIRGPNSGAVSADLIFQDIRSCGGDLRPCDEDVEISGPNVLSSGSTGDYTATVARGSIPEEVVITNYEWTLTSVGGGDCPQLQFSTPSSGPNITSVSVVAGSPQTNDPVRCIIDSIVTFTVPTGETFTTQSSRVNYINIEGGDIQPALTGDGELTIVHSGEGARREYIYIVERNGGGDMPGGVAYDWTLEPIQTLDDSLQVELSRHPAYPDRGSTRILIVRVSPDAQSGQHRYRLRVNMMPPPEYQDLFTSTEVFMNVTINFSYSSSGGNGGGTDTFLEDAGCNSEELTENRGLFSNIREKCVNCGRCDFCDILQGIKNIIDLGVAMVGIFAVLFIIIGGVMYFVPAFYVSGKQADAVNTAKSIITYAIIGLVVVLIAWILVNTLLLALGYDVNIFTWYNPIGCNFR